MIRILSVILATMLSCYVLAVMFLFRDVKEDGLCEGMEIVLRDSLEKHFVTNGDLVYLLKQAKLYPVKIPMNDINTEEIEEKLLSNNMISKVEAYKTPSRLIKLEIEQKMPILRVNSPTGNYYVDISGSVMPLSRHYVAHVLVASGQIDEKLALGDLYKFALFLQEDDFWNDWIVQIHVDSDNNVELVPRVGNHKVVLGTFDDCQTKLENLRLFYEQAIPKVGWEKYSEINLKYKNQIVCIKR